MAEPSALSEPSPNWPLHGSQAGSFCGCPLVAAVGFLPVRFRVRVRVRARVRVRVRVRGAAAAFFAAFLYGSAHLVRGRARGRV